MARFAVLLVAALAGGCVSATAQQNVGKDIRDVMIAEGPAINAFALDDGRKAFQIDSGGCVVTYIAKSRGSTWIVDEVRFPSSMLFCD